MLFSYLAVTHALTLLYILLCMHAAIAFSDVCSLFVVILALRVAWMSHQACCISPALEAEARPPLGCSPLEVRVWVRGLNPSPQVTNSVLPVQNREWEEMVAEGKMFSGPAVAYTWCYWKSRDVIHAENLLLLLSWFDRAQKVDISILHILNFSHFTYNSKLSVHLYLSKQRHPFFHYGSALFSVIQAFAIASRD